MTYVVIGGGLAGGKAVETLREEGYASRIVLVTAEPERPYARGGDSVPYEKRWPATGSRPRTLPADVNVWDVSDPIRVLIGRRVGPARPAGPKVPLS